MRLQRLITIICSFFLFITFPSLCNNVFYKPMSLVSSLSMILIKNFQTIPASIFLSNPEPDDRNDIFVQNIYTFFTTSGSSFHLVTILLVSVFYVVLPIGMFSYTSYSHCFLKNIFFFFLYSIIHFP